MLTLIAGLSVDSEFKTPSFYKSLSASLSALLADSTSRTSSSYIPSPSYSEANRLRHSKIIDFGLADCQSSQPTTSCADSQPHTGFFHP